MKYHANKEINREISSLVASGWCVEKKNKSFKIRSPKGSLVTMSLTPSCPFAIKHIRADIKRAQQREVER